MNWKRILRTVAIMVAVLMVISYQYNRIKKLEQECARYERNTETLLSDVKIYRVRDSLSAARVQSLELTMKEFERFRADDAALIKELKNKNRDLSAVNSAQAQTIIALRSIPKDTVVIRDSIKVPAVAVSCGDEWYTFKGLLTETEFTGTLANRESLKVVESVRYKRFFWFKTKKIKDRQTDVVSLNPYTTITNVESVVIEK